MRISHIIMAAYWLLELVSPSAALAAPRHSPTCSTVETPAALDEALSVASSDRRLTLIYVRSKWAVGALLTNDRYVSSIAFWEVVGDTMCVVVDVTRVGSNEIAERFHSDGIPFFALVDADGTAKSTLLHTRDFGEFSEWFETTRRSRPVK